MTIAAGQIIRASHVDDLVTTYFQAATANTNWAAGSGNVRQDVAGLTFSVTTINPNAIVLAWWTIDVNITTLASNNNFQFRLEVDGVAQPGLAIASTTTNLFRVTPGSQALVTHTTPGTFIYKITGLSGAAAAACTAAQSTSMMSALCIDRP